MDLAVAVGVPFAVVPCCVFAKEFQVGVAGLCSDMYQEYRNIGTCIKLRYLMQQQREVGEAGQDELP